MANSDSSSLLGWPLFYIQASQMISIYWLIQKEKTLWGVNPCLPHIVAEKKEKLYRYNRKRNVFIAIIGESRIRVNYEQSTWKSRLHPPSRPQFPAESIVLENQAMNQIHINVSYEIYMECQGKCAIHAQSPKRALLSPLAWVWLITHVLGGLRIRVLRMSQQAPEAHILFSLWYGTLIIRLSSKRTVLVSCSFQYLWSKLQ